MQINPATHSPVTGRPWCSWDKFEDKDIPLLVPESPLFKLIDRIPADERLRIACITLGPKLGYSVKLYFSNAEELHKWLMPRKVTTSTFWRAHALRVEGFDRALSIEDLRKACAFVPPFLSDDDLEAPRDGHAVRF